MSDSYSISDSAEVLGADKLSSEGLLLVPNRLSFHDVSTLERILAKSFPERKVTYLVAEEAEFDPLLQSHLERDEVEALVFSRSHSVEDLKKTLHPAIAAGGLLVYVPGSIQARVGTWSHVPSEVLKLIVSSGVPLQPLFVLYRNETRLTIEDQNAAEGVVFSFGKLLERERVTLANYQENLFLASHDAFQLRGILKQSLGWAMLQGLKLHGSTGQVIEGTDGSEVRFDKVLAASLTLAKYLQANVGDRRVGIILPPGKGALIANIAVVLAGKIPVNLNFTAGREAVESAIEQAELTRFISAKRAMEKIERFPWPGMDKMLLLDELLPSLKRKIMVTFLMTKLKSASSIARSLKLKKEGGDDEAVLLFTSGSSGSPKGVALSHRNILSNVTQFGPRIRLRSDSAVLGCLPLFHSIGCTVTLWYPVIEGLKLVTYPSPLDTGKLAELIEQYKIALLVSTPTFLRGYLRKATKEQLSSIKLVVTGAEKLPQKVAKAFEDRFGVPVMEGYGLTETSPVSNVNVPNEDLENPEVALPSARLGSVGQLLPGISVRITDPDTDEPLPLDQAGMIWLRGPNIFTGYLGLPETNREVLVNGWFRTGDIGRMDADGFLFIEGRLSRFSKIGGEMVPHETVEAHVNQALGLDQSDRKVAVVGIPDEAKGEALVMISAVEDFDKGEMRKKLLEAGVAALWIPKKVIEVEEIPFLASGKLDIKGCTDLAAS